MSTQVFDNVRVDDVFYSTIAQARDATGITVQDASGTALLQVSTGTVLLFGDQRQENNGIQKQVYLNQRNVGSSAGDLHGAGDKRHPAPRGVLRLQGLRDDHQCSRLAGEVRRVHRQRDVDSRGRSRERVATCEHTGQLLGRLGGVRRRCDQCIPRCCERERWLSDLHSESCTDRVWILSRQCYSERLLRTLWLEAGNPVGASVMIPRKLMPGRENRCGLAIKPPRTNPCDQCPPTTRAQR